LSTAAKEIGMNGGKVISVTASDGMVYPCDHVISTMPITEMVKVITPPPPAEVLDAASELHYRSFIVVSLVVDQQETFPDNWIYIHSPDVKMGRIQNFKNWSRYMVPDQNKTILGIEYFCDEGDAFWGKSDAYLIKFAETELHKIKLVNAEARVIDAVVVRVPNAYPVYSPMYPLNLRFIRNYLQNVPNLQVAGRASMYKYNNMDHSILAGVMAARNTMGSHEDVWSVNTEEEYHEESKS
jgi:protoporphyrinogen oxidase